MKRHNFTISVPRYGMLMQLVADNKRVALGAVRYQLALDRNVKIHIVNIETVV